MNNLNTDITTINNLHRVYHPVGNDSYYINMTSILATNSTITTGRTYLLINRPIGSKSIEINAVKLIAVYYKDEMVTLILLDVLNNFIHQFSHTLDTRKQECSWKLIEMEFLNNKLKADNNLYETPTYGK